MARLVIFDDRVRGLELPNRPVLIGRSRKNDLPINDGLLSRKHCSVVPVGSGYRLLDLKSSNGTYLNGKRIEKVDLAVDDIIEIGNTVMVFLEDGVWNRGEGLAQLRNPLKAQELIGRIKAHHRSRKGLGRIPLVEVGPPPAKTPGERPGRKARRAGRRAPVAAPRDLGDLEGELEGFITQRALLLLYRESTQLRRLVNEVLREVLAHRGPRGEGPDARTAPEGPGSLRRQIREVLEARLGRNPAPAGNGPRPAAGAAPPRAVECPERNPRAPAEGSPAGSEVGSDGPR